MERGETIDLREKSEIEVINILGKNFSRNTPFLLKPRSIYCCSECGKVVLRASMPNVDVPRNLKEEPICSECKIKRGSLIKMEIVDEGLNHKEQFFFFKVVTQDLKSVGLLRAPQIQYIIGEWVYPLEPLSGDRLRGGGLWVRKRRCDALEVKRYVSAKYNVMCRIFICRIGIILYQGDKPYSRVKTDKVMLIEEIT